MSQKLQVSNMSSLVLILSLIASCYRTDATATLLQMPDGVEKDRIIYQKYVELDQDIKKIVGNIVKSMLPFMMEANENLNISSTCESQLFQLVSGIKKLKVPYLKIVDASGKLPSGLLAGNIHMLGDYDECMTTSVLRKDGNVAFKGQYCLLDVKPFLPKRKKVAVLESGYAELIDHTKNTSDMLRFFMPLVTAFYDTGLKFGLCIPSGCSLQDVNLTLEYLAEKAFIDAKAEYCDQQKEFTLRTSMIISICAFTLVGILAVIGSSIHYYSMKKNICYQSYLARFLLCFSVIANFPRVITTKISDDFLKCIPGIRSLSLFYVIFLHEYLFIASLQLQGHLFTYKEEISGFFFQIITNGFFTVEAFFFLGGLVNSYMRMKFYETGKMKLNVIKIIIHRLFRIYPAYIFALLLNYLFVIVEGPVATLSKKDGFGQCETKWWLNILFINNFFHQMDTCIAQGWYIAADMHLFLLSLLTVPVLLRNAKRGIILHLGIIAIGLAVSTFWAWRKDIELPSITVSHGSRNDFLKLWNGYSTTFPHIATYYTGILVGYMLFRWKELKIPVIVRVIGWPVAAISFISMLLMSHKWTLAKEVTLFESALYFAFGRFLFVLAVGWMVVCCCRGYGGVINYILSLKLWIPISKLVFMMYLTSPLLQLLYHSRSKLITDSDRMITIWRYFGDLAISGVMSLVLVTLIESPFIALEKLLYGRLATKKEESEYTVKTENKINEVKSAKQLVFENNFKNIATKL